MQGNVWLGKQVGLIRSPVPSLHEQDNGRYFDTYGFHMVQTPDGSWNSWSAGRLMLMDCSILVGPATPTQHIGIIRKQWRRQSKPTPWAMVFGASPAALATAGMSLPEGVNEAGCVGASTDEPMGTMRIQANGLWIPANAEVVLEGEVSLNETALEGPMGEYYGYSFLTDKPQPLFHVHTLGFHDQSILPTCIAGTPPEENHTTWGTMISAQLLDVTQNAGLSVGIVWRSYETATCWAVLSIDVQRLAALGTDVTAFAARAAKTALGSHAEHLVPKLILVSDDIDVTEIDQVIWALAIRAHPLHNHFAFLQIRDFPMVPYLDAEGEARGSGGRLVINYLHPKQFAGQMHVAAASLRHAYPTALRR